MPLNMDPGEVQRNILQRIKRIDIAGRPGRWVEFIVTDLDLFQLSRGGSAQKDVRGSDLVKAIAISCGMIEADVRADPSRAQWQVRGRIDESRVRNGDVHVPYSYAPPQPPGNPITTMAVKPAPLPSHFDPKGFPTYEDMMAAKAAEKQKYKDGIQKMAERMAQKQTEMLEKEVIFGYQHGIDATHTHSLPTKPLIAKDAFDHFKKWEQSDWGEITKKAVPIAPPPPPPKKAEPAVLPSRQKRFIDLEELRGNR